MTALLFGAGSVTQAQLIAFSAAGVVFLFLLSANVVVCRLYRRVKSEDARQAKKAQKKKMSDVWVYHVHRPTTSPKSSNRESASQQILRKLRTSHENLRATLAASETEVQGTFGQEESQALEELEVTADLFLHDTSCASSRRSSLSGLDSDNLSLPSIAQDVDTTSALHELDKVSLSSVTMADFQNDPEDMMGVGAKRKRGRGSKRRGSGQDSGQSTLPMAEFHNEAFDFAESKTAVERVKDVEL